MLYVLYSYGIAIAYSLLAREVFHISPHNPWNWGPCAALIGSGIALSWWEWWHQKGG